MISKILFLLNATEKRKAALLLMAMIITACFDTIGVASILPFLSALNNQGLIQDNVVLRNAYSIVKELGINSVEGFLFLMGFATFLITIISLLLKASTTVAQTKFALEREYTIAERLVKSYWSRPYTFFLEKHSADLAKNVLSEVNVLVYQGIQPITTLIAQSIAVLMVLALLMFVDALLAILVSSVIAATYLIIYSVTRSRLSRLGQTRITANQERYKSLTEGFAAVKEVKVASLEPFYIEQYSRPAQEYTSGQVTATLIAQLPRFLLEAVAFGGILLIVLYQMSKSGDLTTVIPVVGLYAVAGYKLLPAIQQIYGSATQLRYVSSALDSLYHDLQQGPDVSLATSKDEDSVEADLQHQLQGELRLTDVYYKYPGSDEFSLNGINLKIQTGEVIGVAGKTGSGKTTLVDVILGLLTPQAGSVQLSGKNLIREVGGGTRRDTIGYVPQQINLVDDSIKANIALGVSKSEICIDTIIRVAKAAHCYDFVMQRMSEGFDTHIGERGIRLSGGQRQRIGIARALYHEPLLLVLDEATSALDGHTQTQVMNEIKRLNNNRIIIIVAHRLDTLRSCDKILLMENGSIKENGTFEHLSKHSDTFKAMQLAEPGTP